MIDKIIESYYKNGYSLLPLKNNSKLPCIKWKRYQYKRADLEDILNWYITFNEPNIALITGDRLIAIDLDSFSLLPELEKILPGLNDTTRVKTKRGYHFYFINNNEHRIKSINNLFNLKKVELQGNGRYIVAPPSIVGGHQYSFEVGLKEIQPLPNQIIEQLEREGKILPGIVEKKRLTLPRYHDKGVSCINQILDKILPVGERDNSLFILYNLLLQNKNEKDHSKKIVILKNKSLTKPLAGGEIDNIFRKGYNLKCSTVRERLPFIKCDRCKKFRKGLDEMVGSILIKNIRELPKITNTERGILCMLDVYFSGEKVSVNRIAEATNMDYRIVKKAIENLKGKGILK